jgi:hypothetical protein
MDRDHAIAKLKEHEVEAIEHVREQAGATPLDAKGCAMVMRPPLSLGN